MVTPTANMTKAEQKAFKAKQQQLQKALIASPLGGQVSPWHVKGGKSSLISESDHQNYQSMMGN